MPNPDVSASFSIGDRSYDDVNPTARIPRQSGRTIDGVRPVNANRLTMHAEFGAMLQAYLDGVRGGEGTLVIRDMKACPYFRGDIKVLARAMKLDALTVHDGDGKVIAFSTPDDFLPVRQGGKRWR